MKEITKQDLKVVRRENIVFKKLALLSFQTLRHVKS